MNVLRAKKLNRFFLYPWIQGWPRRRNDGVSISQKEGENYKYEPADIWWVLDVLGSKLTSQKSNNILTKWNEIHFFSWIKRRTIFFPNKKSDKQQTSILERSVKRKTSVAKKTLWTLTSVNKFSIPSFIHFLSWRQGEFVQQTIAS